MRTFFGFLGALLIFVGAALCSIGIAASLLLLARYVEWESLSAIAVAVIIGLIPWLVGTGLIFLGETLRRETASVLIRTCIRLSIMASSLGLLLCALLYFVGVTFKGNILAAPGAPIVPLVMASCVGVLGLWAGSRSGTSLPPLLRDDVSSVDHASPAS